MPYLPCKMSIAAFSAYLACAFTYPWAVMSREMVELWPKEKGGVCTFQGNYRKAMAWLWCNHLFIKRPRILLKLLPRILKKLFLLSIPLDVYNSHVS